MDKLKKSHALSAVSFGLAAIATAWSVSYFESPCLGDYILSMIGSPLWTSVDSGIHLTPFFSIPILIAAIIIAKRNVSGFFSKASLILSSLMIIFLSVTVLYMF